MALLESPDPSPLFPCSPNASHHRLNPLARHRTPFYLSPNPSRPSSIPSGHRRTLSPASSLSRPCRSRLAVVSVWLLYPSGCRIRLAVLSVWLSVEPNATSWSGLFEFRRPRAVIESPRHGLWRWRGGGAVQQRGEASVCVAVGANPTSCTGVGLRVSGEGENRRRDENEPQRRLWFIFGAH
jgi:hypothetical protein